MAIPPPEHRRLRWELEQTRHVLLQRIERLEDRPPPTPPPAPPPNPALRLVAWMGPALPALVGSVVVLVLGYWIKDSVDLAIRQQQLQLSYVKEMQPLLEKLGHSGEGEIGAAGKEQIAILVAGFGEPAVMPLANELRYTGSRLQSAEAGLRTLALTDADALCRRLPAVVASVPPLLGWQGHQAAVGVISAARCTEALPLLREHAAAVARFRDKDEGALRKVVADEPDPASVKDWQTTIDSALAALAAAPQKRRK